MQVLGIRVPSWVGIVVVLIMAVLCLLIVKMIFVDEVPKMRFIVPKGFRGRIQFTRSHTGVVPSVSGSTTTFTIPISGKLEVAGELPFARWSVTEALWSDGQELLSGEGTSGGVNEIYFWSAYSDGHGSTVRCFVGTQDEYYQWLQHGPDTGK